MISHNQATTTSVTLLTTLVTLLTTKSPRQLLTVQAAHVHPRQLTVFPSLPYQWDLTNRDVLFVSVYGTGHSSYAENGELFHVCVRTNATKRAPVTLVTRQLSSVRSIKTIPNADDGGDSGIQSTTTTNADLMSKCMAVCMIRHTTFEFTASHGAGNTSLNIYATRIRHSHILRHPSSTEESHIEITDYPNNVTINDQHETSVVVENPKGFYVLIIEFHYTDFIYHNLTINPITACNSTTHPSTQETAPYDPDTKSPTYTYSSKDPRIVIDLAYFHDHQWLELLFRATKVDPTRFDPITAAAQVSYTDANQQTQSNRNPLPNKSPSAQLTLTLHNLSHSEQYNTGLIWYFLIVIGIAIPAILLVFVPPFRAMYQCPPSLSSRTSQYSPASLGGGRGAFDSPDHRITHGSPVPTGAISGTPTKTIFEDTLDRGLAGDRDNNSQQLLPTPTRPEWCKHLVLPTAVALASILFAFPHLSTAGLPPWMGNSSGGMVVVNERHCITAIAFAVYGVIFNGLVRLATPQSLSHSQKSMLYSIGVAVISTAALSISYHASHFLSANRRSVGLEYLPIIFSVNLCIIYTDHQHPAKNPRHKFPGNSAPGFLFSALIGPCLTALFHILQQSIGVENYTARVGTGVGYSITAFLLIGYFKAISYPPIKCCCSHEGWQDCLLLAMVILDCFTQVSLIVYSTWAYIEEPEIFTILVLVIFCANYCFLALKIMAIDRLKLVYQTQDRPPPRLKDRIALGILLPTAIILLSFGFKFGIDYLRNAGQKPPWINSTIHPIIFNKFDNHDLWHLLGSYGIFLISILSLGFTHTVDPSDELLKILGKHPASAKSPSRTPKTSSKRPENLHISSPFVQQTHSVDLNEPDLIAQPPQQLLMHHHSASTPSPSYSPERFVEDDEEEQGPGRSHQITNQRLMALEMQLRTPRLISIQRQPVVQETPIKLSPISPIPILDHSPRNSFQSHY